MPTDKQNEELKRKHPEFVKRLEGQFFVTHDTSGNKHRLANVPECYVCKNAPGILNFLDNGRSYCVPCFSDQIVPNMGGPDEQAA